MLRGPYVVGNHLRLENAGVKARFVDVGVLVRDARPSKFGAGNSMATRVEVESLVLEVWTA
jgi:hypothetical protein